MKVIFIGDVFGKAGRELLRRELPALRQEFEADFVIANGENLADGKGLTQKTAGAVFEAGVDLLTGGNHLWDRADSLDYIRDSHRIVKPANYPDLCPGRVFGKLESGDHKLAVINLCGQVFMPPCNSPFQGLDFCLDQIADYSPCIILDFHAESTAEKRALAWYADGKISALLGTHTHIQTADEEIMPNGSAYITDLGMTGAHDSVIGVKKEIIVEKFRSSIPARYEASDKGLQINAVFLHIDNETGKALSIQRIRRIMEY